MFLNDPPSLCPMSFVNSYAHYNSWCPITSRCSDMCQASQDSILRMQQSIQQAQIDASLRIQQSKLNSYITTNFNQLNYGIGTTLYYADNVPYFGLNEDLVVKTPKKKKLTIYDLARLIFPDDPIRDYVEKKVAEIEERYRWIDEFY